LGSLDADRRALPPEMTAKSDHGSPQSSPKRVVPASIKPRSWRVIALNFAWLNGERAFDLAIALLVTVLVARYLGPDGFGVIGYLIGLAALFSAVVPLGMDRVIVLELVGSSGDANRLLGTSTSLKLCSALVTGAALAITVPLLNPNLDHALLFGCLFAGAIIAGAFNAP